MSLANVKIHLTVFPACNSAIELSNEELYIMGNAKGWVDVCKGWEHE